MPKGKGTKRHLESYSDSGDSTLDRIFGPDWSQQIDSLDLPRLRRVNKRIKTVQEARKVGPTHKLEAHSPDAEWWNEIHDLTDPELAKFDKEISKRLEEKEASLLEESEISSINQGSPPHRTSSPEAQPSNFHKLFWGSKDQESAILEESPLDLDLVEGPLQEEEVLDQRNLTIAQLVEQQRDCAEKPLSSTDEKMSTHQRTPSPYPGHQSPHSGHQSPHHQPQSPHQGVGTQGQNPEMENMMKLMNQLVMSQNQQYQTTQQQFCQLANLIHDSHVRTTSNQGHSQGQRAQTFKPQMFRQLDMSKVNKDNKLLSEEYHAWQANAERVLRANPEVANQPIDRLANLILAGIGPKAESRLASLGQNPTFLDLQDFFKRLKTIFCSATVQTDAQQQFVNARQYKNEDINSWHSRNLRYFEDAHGTGDTAYWNLCLEKYFQGMSDRKLATETVKEYVNRQPGGWSGQCNKSGYENCLKWTLQCQSEEGFINHLFQFQNKNVPHRGIQYDSRPPPVPMEMGTVSRNGFKNGRMGQAANVNHSATERPRNPPGGMQKRLQREARGSNNSTRGGRQQFSANTSRNDPRDFSDKSNPSNGPRYGPRDKSKDKCNKCKEFGHWARECPNLQTVNTADVKDNVAIIQSENDWEKEGSMGEWAEDLNTIGEWRNDLNTDLANQASKASSKGSTSTLN